MFGQFVQQKCGGLIIDRSSICILRVGCLRSLVYLLKDEESHGVLKVLLKFLSLELFKVGDAFAKLLVALWSNLSLCEAYGLLNFIQLDYFN